MLRLFLDYIVKPPKMGILTETKNYDSWFSLDNTGDWGGGVSKTMITIGIIRVIKRLT